MLTKNIFLAGFMLFVLFTAPNLTLSQEKEEKTEVKIPDIFGIIFGEGNTYDGYGYDKEGYDREGYDRNGYDRYGYNRYGYDRNGYDRKGYDKAGYNRNGYDIYGNYRGEAYYEKQTSGKKHHDNGKHKGWYKNKKKKNKDYVDYNGGNTGTYYPQSEGTGEYNGNGETNGNTGTYYPQSEGTGETNGNTEGYKGNGETNGNTEGYKSDEEDNGEKNNGRKK